MKCWWLGLSLLLSSCVSFTPEMIEALAKDKASFCAKLDASGGAGAVAAFAPSGGYGSSSLAFCRSNQPNAKVTMNKEGISIQHGEVVE